MAVATAQSNLALARADRIAQQKTCLRVVDALIALSGVPASAISALLPPLQPTAAPDIAAVMPFAPPLTPALPATVLLAHPGVVAAEREAAARWSEIAVKRAERLPRIDLAGILTGQWLRVLGSSSSFGTNSLGLDLSAPLLDNGAGRANVRVADADYRGSVATLAFALGTAVRDIEDALAAQQSAVERVEASRHAVEAARFTFWANEARWRAGAIALFELEDSRRQFNRAQESAITAAGSSAAGGWSCGVRGFLPRAMSSE